MTERVDAAEPLVPDFYHYDGAPIAHVRGGDDGLILEWADGSLLWLLSPLFLWVY